MVADLYETRKADNPPFAGSEVYSQATRDLYQDYLRRYQAEEGTMGIVTVIGYASVMLAAQAIEAAGSVDPDEVMKVIDDPEFRFDWFGEETMMAGRETYGIARYVMIYMAYSEVIDRKVVTKANVANFIP